MKTTILALGLLLAVPATATPRKGDVAVETYPEAQAQIRRRLDEIWATLASKVEMKDLAIAVYGDTAIATFNGNFSGKIEGHPVTDKQAVTYVFVKYKGDWKIV